MVVGGTTEAIGLGGVIMSGLGAGPTALVGNASGGVVGFTGGTSGRKIPGGWSVYGTIMMIGSVDVVSSMIIIKLTGVSRIIMKLYKHHSIKSAFCTKLGIDAFGINVRGMYRESRILGLEPD